MAIIDLVRWVPKDNGVTVYAWRFPGTNLSTHSQLVVHESQEAVLFSKGQMIGKFSSGKYTLNTENLPVLRSLYGIPFGGKNPFTAEVWFVNKLQPCNLNWRTDSMSIHDVDYNTQLTLMAQGNYGLKVKDAERFLLNIVGTKSEFIETDLTEQFYGEFSTKTKSATLQFMLKNHIGFKSVSAHLADLSQYLKGELMPFWNNFGLELLQFYITSIDIDTSTENGRKIAEAIATQSSMSITGHTWQQEKMFNVANNAVDSFGNGNGGLIGGLMAMNMMGGMGGGAGAGMMQPQFNQPSFGGDSQGFQGQSVQQGQQVKMVFCSNCSKKYPNTTRFCPHCGDPYNPCPKCGTDNDKNAKRCVSCGSHLIAESGACPHCNAPLQSGAVFCGNCGKQTQSSDICRQCGISLSPSVKFCPKCGTQR